MYQGIVGIGQHKLYAGVVKDFGDTNRQDGILVLGRWTGPGGGQLRVSTAWARITGAAYFLAFRLKEWTALIFLSVSRVGLPTPKYIYIDQKGYVTPINS